MMWRRSTASGSVQETSRGVDAFVREPGGELAQRSSSGARLMGSAVPGRRQTTRRWPWPFFGVSMPKAKIAPFVLKHAIAAQHTIKLTEACLLAHVYTQTPQIRAPINLLRNP